MTNQNGDRSTYSFGNVTIHLGATIHYTVRSNIHYSYLYIKLVDELIIIFSKNQSIFYLL